MLHTPIYDVRGLPYCGPTAIAAVTGEPVSLIRDIIREQIGTKKNGDAMPIIGVSRKVLIKTMETLGWCVIRTGGMLSEARLPSRTNIMRLGDFLDALQMSEQEQDAPFIVNVTRHYYAVDQDEICDTHTRIPLEVHRFKRGRRRWVQCWWQFQKLEE